MENWPAGLQQKLSTDSFTYAFGDSLVRTDMGVGPAKVRSRFTDAVDLCSATILLDYADFSTLRNFYKTNLNNGALPFTFTDPMLGTTSTFRFISPPSLAPLGGRTFKVTLNWERLP